jgi:hypothetical protein
VNGEDEKQLTQQQSTQSNMAPQFHEVAEKNGNKLEI